MENCAVVNDEKLIMLVEKNSCLYNKEAPEYKLPMYKQSAWTKIGKELGVTEMVASKRWKSLRERYSREKKKQQQPSGSGYVCHEAFPLFSAMSFLDKYVVPRPNLFFRTCHLILENVTPVFVLDGDAPELKIDVIAKRSKVQFQGMQLSKTKTDQDEDGFGQPKKIRERKRFKQILKQCENLLKTMGIECVQAPGEAEAFCAFLNKTKVVDGVISQDSDCFAYGATRVYRNFSTSMQGTQAAKDGAVDIYDMEKIQQILDFGQKKVIAMALLCGCDYCPTGVEGVGFDSVLKLFNKYKECEILDKIRCWRKDANKYKTLELHVDDKNICTNCGHIGSTQKHLKCGCAVCRYNIGCNDTLWKERRLLIKAELALRKKALSNSNFPSEEIINEFLRDPVIIQPINVVWKKPNIAKFIKQIGPLLRWTEIYSFQKFFPLLARWQIMNDSHSENISHDICLTPAKILKKRTIKGVSSIEILWNDQEGCIDRLIPDVQLQALESNQSLKAVSELRTTVEPLYLVESAYPTLLESFHIRTEKSKCHKKNGKKQSQISALENVNDIVKANNITNAYKVKSLKKTRQQKVTKNLHLIDKFLKTKFGRQKVHIQDRNCTSPFKYTHSSKSSSIQCSTPKIKFFPSDCDSDNETGSFNTSDAITDIVKRPLHRDITKYTGCFLKYETVMSATTHEISAKGSKEQNRFKSNLEKKISKDDSFDILTKAKENRLDRT